MALRCFNDTFLLRISKTNVIYITKNPNEEHTDAPKEFDAES